MVGTIDHQATAAATDPVEKQIQKKLVINIHGYCNKKQMKKERHLLFFDNNDASDIGIVEQHDFLDVAVLHSKGDCMKKKNSDHGRGERMNGTGEKTNDIGKKKLAHYSKKKKTNSDVAVEKIQSRDGDSIFVLTPSDNDNDARRSKTV
eukprot:13065917-Ditylum_brightwellii.AAC.1